MSHNLRMILVLAATVLLASCAVEKPSSAPAQRISVPADYNIGTIHKAATQQKVEAEQAADRAIVPCNNKANCDKAYSLTQIYINTMATQKIQLATDTIIETYNPTEGGMIGMGAIKTPGQGGAAEIRLSVTCIVGGAQQFDDFCTQKKLDIYRGFRPYVEKMLRD